MAPTPYTTSPMPMRAPISACEELEGRPARQVMRFHVMAPNSTATSIESATPSAGATRLPTVSATSVCSNCVVTTAPMRLRTAEKATAIRGDIARVPTAVPIAFAVSWKPLVKSNRSATPIVRTRRSVCASGILARDVLDHVGHVLTAVERVLEEPVQVLQLDDLQRVALSLEELGDRVTRRRVSEVLEAMNLDSVPPVLLARSELPDRLLELHHRLRQQVGQLNRRRGYGRDSVEVHRVSDLLDVVDDVIEAGRKGRDVLVVEGRDKRLVQGPHDLVGVLVTQVLEVLDLLLSRREVFHAVESFLEKDARAHEYRSLLFEEVVETLLLRYGG